MDHLIRQLDLAGLKEDIGDATLTQYAALFHSSLVVKSIEAIRAATRLVDANITNAATMLVPVELAAQVEATS
jgi:hypothetical protein